MAFSADPAEASARPSTHIEQPKAVPVVPVEFGGKKRKDDAKSHPWRSPKVTWPTASSADVVLDPASGKSVRPEDSSPVSIAAAATHATTAGTRQRKTMSAEAGPPVKARVSVASRAAADRAGVDGLLLSVERSDEKAGVQPVSVAVDYSTFQGAYGGDWAARLRLVEMPACALTTPQKSGCGTTTPLKTVNDTERRTLSATASVSAGAPTVLAATAGESGASGSYKATPLQPSGAWSAGGSTGSFNWAQEIGVPTVPGGLKPSVSLNYSSQSVDGRTAASNNQPSWIGDGWSWEPGYIERRYKSCNDDKDGGTNTTKVGDRCWFNDNATLSLGGKTTELVHDAAKGWHPAQDAGEKIEKLTGASNGDKGTTGVDGAGEHWKVTTTDGTQYFFGLNRLPGWSDHGTADDDPVTNSTLTAPVFGNQTGEPCYNASFASAWCQQAWRWQLDYVVDVHGNAMSYYWKTETNNYGRNVSETTGKATVTPYDRGGYLDHIDYGLRHGGAYTGKAMGRVDFGVDERCLSSCGTFDAANAKNWPDVPYDLYCKDGATECKDQYSASFWSRKKLSTITTKVLTGGTYKDVDSWTLKQGFPASGDGLSTPMWLESIQRTGKTGGSETLPPVTFAGEQLANRVDKTGDGLAPFIRLRMNQVINETGGEIGAYYSDPDCTVTTLPAADGTNKTRCFPVKWAFEGETAKLDWFHSYVVTKVQEGDRRDETPDTITKYSYLDGAAWAKSTDEFTKKDDRTYSVARGYGRVQTRTGGIESGPTLTEARYFRGIDGAAVENSAGAAVTDREQFAGVTRESATYNGDDTSKLVSAVSYTPWRSALTASRTRADLPDLEAYLTGTLKEEERTSTASGTRTTSLTRTFDGYGQVTSESDTGDTAKTGDEKCTTTTYVANTTSRLLDVVAQKKTVAALCGDAAGTGSVISDERMYYDGATSLTAVPSKGDATKVEKLNGLGTGYDTVAATPAADFDVYGRALSATDAYGKETETVYTPVQGEVPTRTLVTNPLGHQITTDVDPLRGLPVKVTDANARVTSTAYDALGRVTKVWLPSHPAATQPDLPSQSFEYQIRKTGPVVVTTKTLNYRSAYGVSYTFYDGLMREMQSQAKSPDDEGRLVTETRYNSRGQAWHSSGVYYATGEAEPVPVTAMDLKYPDATETLFDGAGRTVALISRNHGEETKRTTTSYTGDTTTVIPPAGGTATTTVTDALGRTTELKQYTDAGRAKSQSTVYTYNKLGQLEQVTDPSGATWKYGYDAAGRQDHVEDPDKGASDTAYDEGGRATDVTDARGITLHTAYDDLGRPTALTRGATKLADWEYDKSSKGLGQLSSTTRHDGGNTYISTVVNYNAFYKPVVSRFTVPASEGALAGTYEWTDVYNTITGQLMESAQPAMGDLPDEAVTNAYAFSAGLPVSVSGGDDIAILASVSYDHYGRPLEQAFGAIAQQLWKRRQYDQHTGELTQASTERDVEPRFIDNVSYTYDLAGNIKKIGTVTGQDATVVSDTQCFGLDTLRRITDAWTATDDCAAASPTAAVIGGPDPYWTTYTYDAVGNRKTETQHTAAAGPATDTVRTYQAPEAGTHNLPGITQTGTNQHTETYTYDETGNTRTRKIGNADLQDLTWDTEGHLASVTEVTSTTNYLYDTSGSRMVRRDSTGTTLYLPFGNELHLDKAGKVTGTRYYTAAGETVALRKGGKLSFLINDHHGTSTTQVSADAAQTVTRRQSTIFGAPRGSQPTTWAGDKGFVGGTKDPDTELTHLGAREYDPASGRFISVDPILDLADPQQAHGYTYANNNPVSFSDPSGLRPDGPVGGNDYNDVRSTTDGSNNGKAGSGWFRDSQGGWSYRHQQYWPGHLGSKVSGVTTVSYSWSSRVRAKGKPVSGYVIPHPKVAPKNFYTKWVAPIAVSVLLPDVQAWQDCGGGDLSQCGWSATDLPLLKPLKAIKGAKKAVDAASTAAKKCHSFLPGTRVLLADGTSKKIEDVEKGDVVLATDPDTGETRSKEVIETILTKDDKDFTELNVTTDMGEASIVATDTHPFWSVNQKKWLDAGKVQPGTKLLTSDGRDVEVTSTRHYTKRQQTHDLTVEGIHTYYVLAGATPVLVHNCNLFDGPGWQHVLDEHVDGSPGVVSGNTTFSNYMDLDEIGELIEGAAKTPGRRNTPDATGRPRDGTIHTYDFDYPVGSRGETSVEVILNPNGSLRTAYPR
ncbi:polymorphic toxin-type HINT domain-containing protein [Streptomyces sp. NBC_00654]|uniref:polymorphic toxin-type HINT domain-containing protein n=1 Tax=Streptomyces sp. NBC_00654 TaxID=2975799 RepID=UPI002259602C|nr:polymorphic toxin-type HINT domain-containing protein [Streptomyces sp. NBC_00654]MCX4964401.1 polymorphic toxin-type HINT domain-containing protein [Streptomyces sp. NBC_00654]